MIIGIVVAVIVLVLGAAALYDRRTKQRRAVNGGRAMDDIRRDTYASHPHHPDPGGPTM
jgi:hypothetical protein